MRRFDPKSIFRSQIPPRHLFSFYIGIPLGMAYLFGLNYVGMARFFGLGLSLLYWTGIVLPFWWTLDISSRISALLFRPWNVPWWVILLAGSILAVVLFAPYVQWHALIYARFLPPGQTFEPPTSIWTVLTNWKSLLSFSGVPLIWISVNYYYDRIINIPRYRGTALELRENDGRRTVVDFRENADEPDFLKQIPDRLGRNIYALQAEDHYVRVFTDKGSGLVRFTLRDAAEQLEHLDGARVHRSYWAARHAIRDVIKDGQKYTLILANGVKVPVSRAYTEAARIAGLLTA